MFRDYSGRPGLYRSRKGLILGVCRGLANYFDLNVFWIRLLAVALLLATGFWPMTALYVLAALIMKPEPVLPLSTDAEQEFYHTYASSRSMALQRLKRTYDNLDRRIRRMEHIVTSRDFDWEKPFMR